MAKKYSEQTFTCTIKGEEIEFYCYTTDTRYGFCHTCVCRSHDTTNTKVSYLNRTWERFKYETALASAIKKLPKHLQEEAKAVLIEHKAQEEHERCERQFNAFKTLYEGLNTKNKKTLAESGVEMHTEQDMQGVMGVMALMSATQGE